MSLFRSSTSDDRACGFRYRTNNMEKRYAQALIDISADRNETEAFREDLLLVVTALEENDILRFFLLNPVIGADVKKDIINIIFKSNIGDLILNLLMLLIDIRRFGYLTGIYEEYCNLAEKEKNVLNLTVISARPVTPEQLEKIKEIYRIKYASSSVNVNTGIDKDLIGGVKAKVQSKVTDGTVKARLENLREFLLKGQN